MGIVLPPPAANREIELKLLVPEGSLDSLANVPIITQHARNRGIFRNFESAYFDTPDRQLYRNKIALRVRRSGKTYIQTLKRPVDGGNPLARHEWEVSVPSLVPDLESLPPEAREVGLEGVTNAVLETVFVTKFRRRIQALDLPAANLELAYDNGGITAGERRESINEIELELKAGDAATLYDVALALLDSAPLRVGTLAKADRGYHLAYDPPSEGVRAAKAGVDAQDNVDEIVAKLLGDCRQHMVANQAVVEAGRTPEGVHQMRVALRRMRTAISILQRQIGSPALALVASEAKWLASTLGPVRNWDVLDVDTIAGIETQCPDHKAFAALRESIKPRRSSNYDHLREVFATPRYNRFLLTLGRTVERRVWRNDIASGSLGILAETADSFARQALDRLHRRALKGGSHFRRLQPEAQHELRLKLKKLRYGVEFFRSVFSAKEEAQRYLVRLADLQESLGLANDAATTGGLLFELTENSQSPALHRGAGLITGWQARDKQVASAKLHKVWKRFREGAPFWQM
ncbi:CYTH and CHAD domain-containing protein [Labrys miyagiensis]|uniref:CYTH and CHAD domain-containing protein n=1 Tax=Labrys miyagiensis TaxID=346912 RepID=UPI0024E0EECB|nr:CYTH and CHAD domain-containing protein [Labrys miyagiensis]